MCVGEGLPGLPGGFAAADTWETGRSWIDRVYDNRIIFCIEGGYRPDDEWEFSLRWIFWDEVKNQQRTIYQWGILPVFGVEYEF